MQSRRWLLFLLPVSVTRAMFYSSVNLFAAPPFSPQIYLGNNLALAGLTALAILVSLPKSEKPALFSAFALSLGALESCVYFGAMGVFSVCFEHTITKPDLFITGLGAVLGFEMVLNLGGLIGAIDPSLTTAPPPKRPKAATAAPPMHAWALGLLCIPPDEYDGMPADVRVRMIDEHRRLRSKYTHPDAVKPEQQEQANRRMADINKAHDYLKHEIDEDQEGGE